MKIFQLPLPQTLQKDVFLSAYDDHGHQKVERTTAGADQVWQRILKHSTQMRKSLVSDVADQGDVASRVLEASPPSATDSKDGEWILLGRRP